MGDDITPAVSESTATSADEPGPNMSTAEIMAAAVAAVEARRSRSGRNGSPGEADTPQRLRMMHQHGLVVRPRRVSPAPTPDASTSNGNAHARERGQTCQPRSPFSESSAAWMGSLTQLRARLNESRAEPKGGAPAKSKWESLDYDEAEKDQLKAFAELPTGVSRAIARRKTVAMGALLITIGFCVGSIAHLMTLAISNASDFKWDWVRASVDDGHLVDGWLRLLAVCASLALLAAVLTYWAPDAAGSGIPYVKSYLNGNGLQLASVKTLFVKVVGISCCVTCGVPVGREGPMVHAGAVVAAVLTRLWAHLIHWSGRRAIGRAAAAAGTDRRNSGDRAGPSGTRGAGGGTGGGAAGSSDAGGSSSAAKADARGRQRQERLRRAAWSAGGFDNDRDRRNLVSMGAAAGVAAAFNAPIGGILFSLEEVSSFWDPELTWTTFLAAATAAFTVNYWTNGISGTFSDSGLVLFADGGPETTYYLWELLPFSVLGVVCGLLGAVFNAANKALTVRRKRLLGARPRLRVLEAVAVVCLVVSIYFWVASAFGCTDAPAGASSGSEDHRRALSAAATLSYQAHECSDAGGSGDGSSSGSSGGGGAQMNEMATLLLQPAEMAVVQLFSRGTAGFFSLSTLALFLPLYFCSAAFTYGITVPSGLFIPCMTMGAAAGRLSGELLRAMGFDSDPGVHALVGAAGMLGGVTRMTVSLAVILVEVSNDIQLLLPIMLAILLAKFVGDRFTISLYDIHIILSGATLLETPPPTSTQYLLTARELLSRPGKPPLRTVREAETLKVLSALLGSTTHHAFPVVSEQSGAFAGLVGRAKLEALLAQAVADGARSSRLIDLRPHFDHAPYVVHELLPVYRVSRLFVGMGLRHLCVLDGNSRAIGILTRKDLAQLGGHGHHAGVEAAEHLDASVHGGTVQKRMLDASHAASRVRAQERLGRRGSDPGGLPRTCSEPNVLDVGSTKDASPSCRRSRGGSNPTAAALWAAAAAAHRTGKVPTEAQLRLLKRRASV